MFAAHLLCLIRNKLAPSVTVDVTQPADHKTTGEKIPIVFVGDLRVGDQTAYQLHRQEGGTGTL